MYCPICASPRTRVVDSRPLPQTDQDDTGGVTRVRECAECQTRWRTQESFVHLVRVQGEGLRAERIQEGCPGFHEPPVHHGPRTPRRVSTEAVQEIRAARGNHARLRELAGRYGIHFEYARKIAAGRERKYG